MIPAPIPRDLSNDRSSGVSPQPFTWDRDSGARLLEMVKLMAVVSYDC